MQISKYRAATDTIIDREQSTARIMLLQCSHKNISHTAKKMQIP